MANEGAIELAKSLHLQGRMAEAEALYRDLLSEQPDAGRHSKGWASCFISEGR